MSVRNFVGVGMSASCRAKVTALDLLGKLYKQLTLLVSLTLNDFRLASA